MNFLQLALSHTGKRNRFYGWLGIEGSIFGGFRKAVTCSLYFPSFFLQKKVEWPIIGDFAFFEV